MQNLKKGLFVIVVLSMALLAGATTASAHLERPSYWPNPAADNSVSPATGGGVPGCTLPQRSG